MIKCDPALKWATLSMDLAHYSFCQLLNSSSKLPYICANVHVNCTFNILTFELETRRDLSWSKPSKAPSWLPEVSVYLGCMPNRVSDLQNRSEKWCNKISLFLNTCIGMVWRWLNSIGIFSGSLQMTFLLTDDQATLWAEPQVTWSTWISSGRRSSYIKKNNNKD